MNRAMLIAIAVLVVLAVVIGAALPIARRG